MPAVIRTAVPEDADAISDLVIATLRASNSKDYSHEIIARVELSFGPQEVAAFISRRDVFVATIVDAIVGTASLEGYAVRSVFVHPDYQRQGIGRALMHRVEGKARELSVTSLLVPASITSESFYSRLGYKTFREQFDGAERTLIMARQLARGS